MSKIKDRYIKWREHNGISIRCDIKVCQFHKDPPHEWNSGPIKLQLDHINGNSRDNFVLNLRLVCPNCHSQFPTTGARNKGRIHLREEGYFEYVNSKGMNVQVATSLNDDECFDLKIGDKEGINREEWENIVDERM